MNTAPKDAEAVPLPDGRALAALISARATLEDANIAGGSICDTIWHGPGETLFDFMDSEIEAERARLAAQRPAPSNAEILEVWGRYDEGVDTRRALVDRILARWGNPPTHAQVDAAPPLTDALICNIACVLAEIDGYDPKDERGGLYDLRWSGGPTPEPEGDAWSMDYLPKAERIAKAISITTQPAPHDSALDRACDLLSLTVGTVMSMRRNAPYTDNSPIASLVREVVEFLEPWPEKLPATSAAAPHDSSETRDAAQGYIDAFYELAALMGVGARPESPATVWKTVMLPRLRATFQEAERYRWLRSRPLDDDEIYIAVDSAKHPGRWALGGSDPEGCDAAIDAALSTPTASPASNGSGEADEGERA